MATKTIIRPSQTFKTLWSGRNRHHELKITLAYASKSFASPGRHRSSASPDPALPPHGLKAPAVLTSGMHRAWQPGRAAGQAWQVCSFNTAPRECHAASDSSTMLPLIPAPCSGSLWQKPFLYEQRWACYVKNCLSERSRRSKSNDVSGSLNNTGEKWVISDQT